MFAVIRKIHGVKVHNLTAVGDSVALGDVENENRWVQKAITEAGAKVDIMSAKDL